jgi:hypothetical protein
LANLDASDETLGFSEGTTHTGLESIGSSARQLDNVSFPEVIQGDEIFTILLMRTTW